MGYNEWMAGYNNSMRGPDLTVGALLSNEHGRANGFGDSHRQTVAESDISPYADEAVDNDLSIVMKSRPTEESPVPQAPEIHIAPVAGAVALAGEAQVA